MHKYNCAKANCDNRWAKGVCISEVEDKYRDCLQRCTTPLMEQIN